MNWLLALVAAFWTWGVGAYALWAWRAPDRWKRAGKLDSGLGTIVEIDAAKVGTRIWLASFKVFAGLGFLMAMVGAIGVAIALWRAISEVFS